METAKDASSPAPSATGTVRTARNSATTKIKADTCSSGEGDLLALLQLERLAQQASRRDYELLRKQYQRYFSFLFLPRFFSRAWPFRNSSWRTEFVQNKSRETDSDTLLLPDKKRKCCCIFFIFFQRLKEELEWRDSGHGDDLGDGEFSSELISDRDRDSDSVQMKPSVALKSWTWRSSSTPR